MVVFTCQHCGEPVKKPLVIKHYTTKCRFKCIQLTCVDCLKDFGPDDHGTHNDCITELQRYSAVGTVSKEQKGKKKQGQYIEMIQTILDDKHLSPIQKKLLEVCSRYDNVPRKVGRFKNFLVNVARAVHYKDNDVDIVFNLIENAWSKHQQGKVAQDKNSEEKESTNNNHEETNSSLLNGKTQIEENEEIINESNTDTPKTKKKKKHIDELPSSDEKNDVIGNGELQKDRSNENISDYSNTIESCKSRNKKRKSKSLSLDDDKTECKESDYLDTERSSDAINGNADDRKENVSNLSKKQLKKQKKYEKYLKELENEAKSEVCGNINIEKVDDTGHIKKKKKKNREMITPETNNVELESLSLNEDKNSQNTDDSISKQDIKKSKKRKLEETICETPEKKTKDIFNEGDEGPAVFNWGDVIMKVLQSRPDNELSLKKLGKKVVNEYQAIKQDHRTYEELLAKFNKKVHKTKGVRVLRDKAKLVE